MNDEKAKITELFMDICMDLWSRDASISYQMFASQVKQYIENLKSHMGYAAHLHEQTLGITDETGMSWEQQDEQTQKQIDEYEALLRYLETDDNWIP